MAKRPSNWEQRLRDTKVVYGDGVRALDVPTDMPGRPAYRVVYSDAEMASLAVTLLTSPQDLTTRAAQVVRHMLLPGELAEAQRVVEALQGAELQ